jgi:dTDP-4-dehydrorhamnose reductase
VRVIIFGIDGLIGSTLFKELSSHRHIELYGTTRSRFSKSLRKPEIQSRILLNIDASNVSNIRSVCEKLKPNLLINCIGITKHVIEKYTSAQVKDINSNFPFELLRISNLIESRLVQISTDCVFSGVNGNYNETDVPDAIDLYGQSKFHGEIISDNTLTIRTSTIGHEEHSKFGLLEWFLSQDKVCDGYTKAIFSGLTTIELARILEKYVIFNLDLNGLYHIGTSNISKFDLLNLISKIYHKKIMIEPDNSISINRSLDSTKFIKLTGYNPPNWEELIFSMYKSRKSF